MVGAGVLLHELSELGVVGAGVLLHEPSELGAELCVVSAGVLLHEPAELILCCMRALSTSSGSNRM